MLFTAFDVRRTQFFMFVILWLLGILCTGCFSKFSFFFVCCFFRAIFIPGCMRISVLIRHMRKWRSRTSWIGSLSTRVFETRTAAGIEWFPLLTCLHTTTFTLLSIFSPLEMISIKIWEKSLSWHAKCSLPVAVRLYGINLHRHADFWQGVFFSKNLSTI